MKPVNHTQPSPGVGYIARTVGARSTFGVIVIVPGEDVLMVSEKVLNYKAEAVVDDAKYWRSPDPPKVSFRKERTYRVLTYIQPLPGCFQSIDCLPCGVKNTKDLQPKQKLPLQKPM